MGPTFSIVVPDSRSQRPHTKKTVSLLHCPMPPIFALEIHNTNYRAPADKRMASRISPSPVLHRGDRSFPQRGRSDACTSIARRAVVERYHTGMARVAQDSVVAYSSHGRRSWQPRTLRRRHHSHCPSSRTLLLLLSPAVLHAPRPQFVTMNGVCYVPMNITSARYVSISTGDGREEERPNCVVSCIVNGKLRFTQKSGCTSEMDASNERS